MEQVTQVKNRLDALDVEAFEKMLASDSFLILKMRIAGEVVRAQNDCESLVDERELRRAQGAVRALRAVLALPAMILQNMNKRGTT